jgi:hypothetical protein
LGRHNPFSVDSWGKYKDMDKLGNSEPFTCYACNKAITQDYYHAPHGHFPNATKLCYDCMCIYLQDVQDNPRELSNIDFTLLLLSQGYAQVEIAGIIHVSRKTVQRWLGKVRAAGIEALPCWVLDRLRRPAYERQAVRQELVSSVSRPARSGGRCSPRGRVG